MGAIGAMWGLLTAESVMFSVALLLVLREVGSLDLFSSWTRPLAAALLTAGFIVWVLKDLSVFVALPVAAGFCAVCLLLVGAVGKGDIIFFWDAMRPAAAGSTHK